MHHGETEAEKDQAAGGEGVTGGKGSGDVSLGRACPSGLWFVALVGVMQGGLCQGHHFSATSGVFQLPSGR